MFNHIIKTALLLAGVIFVTGLGDLVEAQSTPPSAIGNTAPPNFDSLPPRAFDNVQPVRQQNFVIDSGSGSEQFFRQGGEQLYLLPEENSEPILKINETIKEEEVRDEDLPEKGVEE